MQTYNPKNHGESGKKVFDFQTQMKAGDLGEALFLKCYASLEPQKSHGDLRVDFHLKDGKTIELKADTYREEDTPNFFMEYFSDMNTGKKGGPWRALDDGIDYFVYLFLKNKTFYWFEPRVICPILDKFIEGKSYKQIKNKGWLTIGYTVPRDSLSGLLVKKDVF